MSVSFHPRTSSSSSTTPPSLPSTISSSPSPPYLKVLSPSYPFQLAHFLPPVTTRTTSLSTISHPSFTLRFSDLADTERACLEDDEKRAARTIDWIGERITKQCAHWLSELDTHPDRSSTRTPWWDELSRCAEGDHLPSKYDGWNHPVSSLFLFLRLISHSQLFQSSSPYLPLLQTRCRPSQPSTLVFCNFPPGSTQPIFSIRLSYIQATLPCPTTSMSSTSLPLSRLMSPTQGRSPLQCHQETVWFACLHPFLVPPIPSTTSCPSSCPSPSSSPAFF